MAYRRRTKSLVASITAAMLFVIVSSAGWARTQTAGVIPPQAHPYGATYGDWQARWNQWFFSIPASETPADDETGERCWSGQTGRVWFEAPVGHLGTTERTCTIPAGDGLLLIVASSECSSLEGNGETEAELASCATSAQEMVFGDASFTLRIDGRVVEDLAAYRTQTSAFALTVPDGNVLGVAGGTGLSVSDGTFVMLAPLSVGEHRIELHADIASGPFAGTTDENYTITVAPRRSRLGQKK